MTGGLRSGQLREGGNSRTGRLHGLLHLERIRVEATRNAKVRAAKEKLHGGYSDDRPRRQIKGIL